MVTRHWQILTMVLAAAASVATLLVAGAGRAPAPFGFTSVVVAHTLAALPLAWLIGSAALQETTTTPRRVSAGIALAVFALFAAASVWQAAVVARLLDGLDAGFIGRTIARTAWCSLLLIPAALAASRLLAVDDRRVGPAGAIVALLVAFVLPSAYVDDLARRETIVAAQLVREGQVARALPLVESLSEIGSPHEFGAADPRAARDALRENVRQLEQAVASPLAEDAPAQMRLERARQLAALDRLDDALEAVRDLSEREPEAALLTAGLLQALGRTELSSFWFRVAGEQLADQADERALAGRRRVFDGLAYNAREERRYRDAEVHYLEGIEALPAARGHFHLRLAQHYQLAGRPAKALAESREAVALDPRLAADAAALERELRINTPACLLK